MLRKHKRIEDPLPKRPQKKKRQHITTDDLVKSGDQIKADKFIDIIDDKDGKITEALKNDPNAKVAFEELMDKTLFTYKGGKKITSADWKPENVIHHSPEFVAWIDSILSGFQNMVHYEPFRLYCQQAEDWLSENGSITDYSTGWEKKEYAHQEFRRCAENTLYGMDKYLMLKEGDLSDGSMKYLSKPVHKVMCFLVDAGYSFMMGKPRQIAATSTLAGIAMFKMIFRKNYFIKMIAQDKDKVIEIFEDKIKYPFGELPEWMKPSVSNDRDNLFRLGKKTSKKGSRGGVGSKIQVVAPSVAAINGGSPPMVMIDEAGYINILGKMMKEARPTMFMQDPETKLLKMKRQILIWGTGGEMDKGGKAYEEEFFGCLEDWQKRKFATGIIPIFFDWTTRPGITQEHYDNEKIAYSVEGPEKEAKKVQFRQHYPSIIEDMFLTSAKTLVSIDWINENLERIRKMDHELRPVRGYFEPIWDEDKPTDEHSDVPFAIKGATFVPVSDGDPRGSCWMFMPPNHKWRNRYYQGTDPVMSDDGYSNMSGVIIDAHYRTLSAIVDYRDSDHKYTFLQTMLLGIYYSAEPMESVKELVESNLGGSYIDYKEFKGYRDSMTYRTELPLPLQGGSQVIGLDNRGNRSKFLINIMYEFLKAFGDRIWIDIPFVQLRTFICKMTESGNVTWGVADKRKYHDDVLYAMVFAYICMQCYDHKPPVEIGHESQNYRWVHKLVRKNGKLDRVRVKEKIRR